MGPFPKGGALMQVEPAPSQRSDVLPAWASVVLLPAVAAPDLVLGCRVK